MAEYIEKATLYKDIGELEELARNRVLDTPTNSPVYVRYVAQLNERTMLKHKIFDFPSADVAPVVHGKWAHLGGDEWCCTNCGFVITTEGSWENPTENYCPNCGAKMDLEEQNNE